MNQRKIAQSRNKWKQRSQEKSIKLKKRANKINYLLGKTERLTQTIVQKDKIIRELTSKTNQPEKLTAGIINEPLSLKVISVFICLNVNISFRSIPKFFMHLMRLGICSMAKIPHFSSIINWTMLFGLHRLKHVNKVATRWTAIIDTTFEFGSNKLLVVLRAPLDHAGKNHALTLSDVEVIGLQLRYTWDGDSVCKALTDIFEKAGCPTQLIRDSGGDLSAGIKKFMAKTTDVIVDIRDIGHINAKLLEKAYALSEPFQAFTQYLSLFTCRFRQTKLAFLIPPRFRQKGRFQSISVQVAWYFKVMNFYHKTMKKKAADYHADVIQAFEKLENFRCLLTALQRDVFVTDGISKILKRQGMNTASYRESMSMLEDLPPNYFVREKLADYLLSCRSSAASLNATIHISSDVIEILFGKFKAFQARGPDNEFNRSVLVIPLLTRSLELEEIGEALKATPIKELAELDQKFVGKTIRKSKIEAFGKRPLKNQEPKLAESQAGQGFGEVANF